MKLSTAINQNDLTKVKTLVQENPGLLKDEGINHLLDACCFARWTIAYWLLENGVDIDPHSKEAQTIFFDATRDGELNFVVSLVEKGVDVNCLAPLYDETAIFFAADRWQWDVVAWLALHGAIISTPRVRDYDPPLLYAVVKANHKAAIEALVKCGIDVNQKHKVYGEYRSAITTAIQFEEWSVVELLLQKDADINKNDITHIANEAIETGRNTLFQFLQSRKIDAHTLDARLFFAALHFQQWDFARYMIRNGVQYNANRYKCDVDVVAQNQHWDLIQLLVSWGISPNWIIKSTKESLFQAACRARHWNTVVCLTKHDTKVNLQDENGETVLHHAVRYGQSKTVGQLLKCNADINIQNDKGETAAQVLHECIEGKAKHKISKLLKAHTSRPPLKKQIGLPSSNTSKNHVLQLGATTLSNQLFFQHQKGLIALHLTMNPLRLSDRLDHPIIINNLREDGGSIEKSHLGYKLYPIISTTILPPAHVSIVQKLYYHVRPFFTVLDVQQTQIKTFCHRDSYSTYDVKNKFGRPSYRPFGWDSINTPYLKTLSNIKLYNEKEIPSYLSSRTMNEMTLKIRAQSMLGIGTIASYISSRPDLLLGLIYFQSEFRKFINIHYPILLYNNDNQSVSVPWVAQDMITIPPNQFYEVKVNLALKELLKEFPNGIDLEPNSIPVLPNGSEEHESIQERIREITPDWHEYEDPRLPDDADLNEQDKTKRQKYLAQTNEALTKLESKLSCMQNLDSFMSNKKNKLGDPEFDFYPEINQEKINKFIKNNILLINDTQALNFSEENALTLYSKSYNLVFRLQIYVKLLADSKIINYGKIQEDLQWSSTLHALLDKNTCLCSVTPHDDQIKPIKRTSKLSFWQEADRKPFRSGTESSENVIESLRM